MALSREVAPTCHEIEKLGIAVRTCWLKLIEQAGLMVCSVLAFPAVPGGLTKMT
ncbi:hypothetical protein [Accumulibacter sp.]|uniref:hypothetical protein n=1 Tax=Accumulibacter sp. TaxID=2053492 RepID=UPI0026398B10|nr:hypothetical protein [Accumulibacter sp.]